MYFMVAFSNHVVLLKFIVNLEPSSVSADDLTSNRDNLLQALLKYLVPHGKMLRFSLFKYKVDFSIFVKWKR